jgi:hypothetical protein
MTSRGYCFGAAHCLPGSESEFGATQALFGDPDIQKEAAND